MRRPLQIEVENRISHRVEIRTLDQPFATIGRDPDCDIVLEDRQVSRRHAYLQVVGGRLFWVDLDSQLGTFVDGQAWKSGWLGSGRTIAIGPNDIRQIGEAGSPSPEEPPGSPLIWRSHGIEPLAEATVEFLNGPSESKTWPVRRVLSLIGTARRCKFRLADRSIEPFHCSLVRTPEGLFIVDLLGGSGIRVNDQPARSALVRDQDMLQVGRYQIRVHSAPAPADAGSVADQAHDHLPQPLLPMVPAMSTPVNRPVEVMPYQAGATLSGPIGANELTESLLVPLVSQFGMMQQQMFDQFQQTMSMMMQMFGKMHDSQMELIRQEFDRLNDLTKEIDGLKAELAEMTRNPAKAPIPPSPIPTPRPRPSTPTPTQKPAAPRPAGEMSPEAIAPPADQALPSVDGSGQPPEGDTPPAQGDRDVIFWLHQRMTSIQKEREGRWQKILKLLPGAS